MTAYDDISEDLFAAIDAVFAAEPDLEEFGPAEIVAFGTALQVACAQLAMASLDFENAARVALPEWEGHQR